MKRKKVYRLFWVFLLCMVFSQKVSAKGQVHSLSVSTLSITKNSQETFYWLMCNNILSGYRCTQENQHVFFSEDMTFSQMDMLLDNAFGKSQEGDLNYFYFTGHTVFDSIDPPTNPLGICINNSNMDYYAFKPLAEKLNSYRGKMVVILDTCGSEAFIQEGIETLDDSSHIYALCSCGYLQESEFGRGILNPYLFFHGYRYNAFTYALGKGLGFFNEEKELLADADSNGTVSLDELYTYIKNNIKTVNQVMDTQVYPNNSKLEIFSYGSPGSNVNLKASEITCYVSEKKTITVLGTDAGSKKTWKSSNSNVAKVDSKGVITAKKAGKCTITVKVNKKVLECVVTVLNPSIKLKPKSASVYIKESVQLRASVRGAKKTVIWKSSNPSIASVDKKGKVIGKKAGTVTITAKANGKVAKCAIKVKKPSIVIDKSPLSLIEGKTYQLTAVVKGKSKKIKWESSNQEIAIVDSSGKVTAKKAGKATITAKANGKTAQCEVIVKKDSNGTIELTSKVKFQTIADVAKTIGLKEVINYSKEYKRYSADGTASKDVSYIECFYENAKEKGTWHIVVLDKKFSVYGIKVGMDRETANRILINKGWENRSLWNYISHGYTYPGNHIQISLDYEIGGSWKISSIDYSYRFWEM